MTQFTIEDTNSLRLDRFIRRECFYLPQGIIEKHLRLGDIKVNGLKAKSSVRLKKGDVVTVSDQLQKMASSKNEPTKITNFSPAVISLAHKMLNEYLILDSEEFIAINKPFGLATQGGSKINISIDHALAYLNATQKAEYRLVHRLDKDTSGVLIIAKNLNSCMKLGDAFKTKELQKTYLAVGFGVPKLKQGAVENYIGKDRSGVYDLVTETPDGKLAKTLYEVIPISEYDPSQIKRSEETSHGFVSSPIKHRLRALTNQVSSDHFNLENGAIFDDKHIRLIKYMPQTGRMHQLRFHSKQLGCPILGDIKYGGKPFDRMMLHAWKITIPASIFGEEYNIVAPWDQFFEKYIRQELIP